jgi:O-antigen/teichoic acid export membrane protein
MVGSAAVIILGLVLAGPFPSGGAVVTVVGILSLMGFLLYVWRIATTRDDQWIWLTPGKRRREYLAEQAAKHESEVTSATPDGHG